MLRRQSIEIQIEIQKGWCTANTDSIVLFLSDEGPTLETLDYTIRIGSAPTVFIFRFACILNMHMFILMPNENLHCREIAGDLDYNFVINK